MKNTNNDYIKTQLFEQFYWVWAERYELVKKVLRYIATYPWLFYYPKINQFIHAGHLDYYHTEWLYLLTKFNHKADKRFFRPYYVMITQNAYEYYVDLSNPDLPVYYFDYTRFTRQWSSVSLFNLIELMLLADHRDFDFDNLFDNLKEYIFWDDISMISPDDFGF